ncbi:hypothetical protein A3Q56_03435 [Intoshia linei]|uniref:Uncharacterized protein n=1 Tax=Intoshia linei TaxID=1819745 RepID=A0A177B3G4_9BILA|nr:hypothetical protein A3Q56_03435 [Intoshia linei]
MSLCFLWAVESRRLARIKKQEDEIIQLKERMKQRESVEEGEGSEELKIIPEKESDSSADSDEADQLIEKMNEQEKMNIRNLSANREKQRQIMEKRLQAKKNKQNAKAKRRATHSLNVGKSLTGKILENSIFKNKQNNMFRQLSKELHSEAEIIKKEMQLDLDKQLKEQNQQFIQQLSKLGNISISQLKEINESLQELDTS